jgi:hypothetical protein
MPTPILYVFTPEASKEISERIIALTGHTADLSEALDQWEAERELTQDLHENYDRYRIENTQLIKLVRQARMTIDRMNADAGLFLKDKSRQWMQDFTDELEKVKKAIPQLMEPPF